ncbi:GTP binding protein [Schizosaccharomyces japonicus yFS275]|uniref:GTP binding protein n=1 Tax=Schizosaccharomyces japonicus (strain yFS275 / FY16936) TaxID=402676 RepID=B6K0E5_SCHJY|nr:GTP binding protein [Schizosaccharomyces japonicus yFS275]EEB06295.2 GTP binding protein [Schizosaccharomyces japonicus yFS275]
MGLPKSKNHLGLGRAIQNDFMKGRRNKKGGLRHITDPNDEPSWVKLRSVTQQTDLDEFLSTAELSNVDFTAEKLNVKVIQNSEQNPFLLNSEQEAKSKQQQELNKDRLTIPCRPPWDENTTPVELERNERQAFLEWRRSLAQLQEIPGFVVTPFERNLEVWRQLWRVIERSDVIVQIVDARNPLFYRSAFLEQYVKEVDPCKKNFLLVNKADMLTDSQRQEWASYFKSHNITFLFFSARLASEQQELAGVTGSDAPLSDAVDTNDDYSRVNPIKIANINMLSNIFNSYAEQSANGKKSVTIGLVGYPNVGKSSTINALAGAKKVSVSSTPGKTKHFQTIKLSPTVMLCDCPGLVFPSFADTQADLVLNGVLPIDQLREHTGPAALVASRFPKDVLEKTYAITIHTRPVEEGGSGIPTADEFLYPYAVVRGFMRAHHGNPDDSRAARYVLKDYVNGKIIYCHPPPTYTGTGLEFNAEHHRNVTAIEFDEVTNELKNATISDSSSAKPKKVQNPRSKTETLDTNYFRRNALIRSHVNGAGALNGSDYRGRTIHHAFQQRLNDDGTPMDPAISEAQAALLQKPLSRRKARQLAAMDLGVSPELLAGSSKKHNKKNKRGKQRSGQGYDI